MGPNNVSIDGFSHFLTIVVDCTRFTWTIMMRNKGEADVHVQQFFSNGKKSV